MTDTQPAAVATAPKNPFIITLLVVAICSLVVAGALVLMTSGSPSNEDADAWTIWSGLLTNLGAVAALLWLTVSAITWKAPASS